MSYKPRPVADRFWTKVVKTNGCWLWKAATMARGYGKIWDGIKLEGAHRVSWILAYGDIPNGLFVLHKCDNPPCVNPDHLFLGTNADNRKDCIAKHRWAPIQDRKGEQSNSRKLSNEQVLEIRRRNIPRKTGSTILAREFGVHRVTIQRILRRQTWSHI